MRVLAPTLTLEPGRAVATARFTSETGAFAATDVQLGVPRHLLGRIDLTANPFVPIAAVVAAACGEDVDVDGPVAPAVVAAARDAAATMAGWWGEEGWRTPAIAAPASADPTPEPGRGHGLYFSLGVDSWASLIALRSASADPVTHLLTIDGTDLRAADEQAEVTASVRRTASELGMNLVELDTNARELVDQVALWDRTHGAVLAAFAHLLSPLLAHASIASSHSPGARPKWGSHSDLDHRWGTSWLRLEHHHDALDRTDKVAAVAAEPLALRTLLVCWEGGGATNCGRCNKCLRTMTALHLAGALDRSATFPPTIEPAAVRATARPDAPWYAQELVDRLPAGELRTAWAEHVPPTIGLRPLADPASVALAGPSLATRLEVGLEATGWAAVDPTGVATRRPDPDAPTGAPLAIGWEPGQVPLRPALATLDRARAAVAGHHDRPVTWAIAELADPDRCNDPGAATVASRAEQCWGEGLCYLAGVAWADPFGPELDADAVGRLLGAARLRLWWRADGTLDALRVVESVEHGCLPLQVMPPAAADRLRRRLPPALAAQVVTLDELPRLDVSPDATAAALAATAAVLLSGSVERDLALDAAFQPAPEPDHG